MGKMSNPMKKIISTPLAPAALGPYSQGVLAGPTLYVSGQVPIDPATGKLVDGDISAQTRRVMDNIEAILRAAGYGWPDVVKCTCLLADMADFQAFNAAYAERFPSDPPARATFAVKGLPLGALLEVEAVAFKSPAP